MSNSMKLKRNSVQSYFKHSSKRASDIFVRGYKGFKALKRTQQILIILGGSLFLAFVLWGAAFYYQIKTPSRLFDDFPEGENPDFFDWGAWDAQDYFDQNFINVVLLGFDKNEDREEQYTAFRTDSIKVLSINLDKETASIINIPRDIYIQIADTNLHDKIGHAYVYGFRQGTANEERHMSGIKYSLKSISNVLAGVPIHYYITVDMDAVVKLVDAIGGVEFTVEEDVYFKGRLWVPKGHQVLDGKKYLRYLRSREDGGDIGRVNRQTELLLATLEHFKKRGLFIQVPALYNAYQDLVDTNLTSKQIISLALFARNLSTRGIETHTISGRGQSKDGVYYMVMNQSKRAEIIKNVFGIKFDPPPDEELMDTTPAAPRSFAVDYLAKEAGKKGVFLTWKAGDRHNLSYNIYRSLNTQEEVLLASGIEEEMYWDMDVAPGNVYFYRLEAFNRRAVSEAVSASIEVKQEAPASPASFQAALDRNNVLLTWKSGDNTTTGFRLYREDGSGQETTLMDGVMKNEYLDKSLPPGTYVYRIVALNSAGLASDPTKVTLEIKDAEAPGEPEYPEYPEDPEDPKEPEDPDGEGP